MFKFSEIEYVRPDLEKVNAEFEKVIKGLSSAKNYAEARQSYIHFEKVAADVNTMYSVAFIRNTMDTRDKFYDDEMNFFFEENPRIELVQKEVGKLVILSPFVHDFEKEFGSDFIKNIAAQMRLADESVVQEKIEEGKLGQEYSSSVAGCSVNFGGEDCNFYGLLKHMLSPDRAERKQAFEAWAALYESVSQKLDDIFDRLVALRKQMAKKLGFANYVEMAYLANNHFYYSAEDVAAFRRQVVEEVVPAAAELYERQRARLGVTKLHMYDEQLVFPEGNASPAGDTGFMLNAAREMYHELSAETAEFIDFMTEHGLFDLETRPGKHMGGYCTLIQNYGAPFIFSNFNGSSADVGTLTHEAGHAFQAYTASRRVPLVSQVWSTTDVSEIHSMSMELFTYPYMEKFFCDRAENYRYEHLSEALKTIPYLCLVDHFQYEVYTHDYNAAERRACWHRLEKIYMPWRDYDGNAFLCGGGYWMQKQHIFLYPFYYVDYALAQMSAFEYYNRSQKNRSEAWADYLELCRAGGSKSYFDLLKLGNLSSAFDEGAVKRAIAPIADLLLNKHL